MKRLLLTLTIASAAVIAASAHESFSYEYPESYDHWQEAFLAGNGKTGIMVFGNPRSETVVLTSRWFNFPGRAPRSFAKVPRDTVGKISALCAAGEFKAANDLAVSSSQWHDGGQGGRHPGYMISIKMPDGGVPTAYRRTCDFSTGEIRVEWSDSLGSWRRRSFVSRVDDVAAFSIASTDGHPVSCAVSLSLPAGANFPKGMAVAGNSDATSLGIRINYASPSDDQGFGGTVRYAVNGGRSEVRGDTLFVEEAREVTLIAGTGVFTADDNGLETIARRVGLLRPDYDALFAAHKAVHGRIFSRVNIDLGADEASWNFPNEELLARQRASDRPVAALWERIFDSGRYHYLSSSSELTPPDLLGIWTGDCSAGWGGYYHLDANLNLQVAGGNIGSMPEAMEGYFHLNEVWADDFARNAADLLGCRGMVACGNTPGLSSGLMASINEFYPYHYATGEEAWLLYPFWEHYLVTGDKEFLRMRLYPLLSRMGEFYEDFLRHCDSNGRFILTGSVSPENRPANLPVSLLNNSAFDVAGARWTLSTLVRVCDILGIGQGEGGERERCAAMFASLPDYRINSDGAIAEWGWEGLEDQYAHRHSSHLMMVWPFRETSPRRLPEVYAAAGRALDMRDRHDYENAGHGYLHAALIAAGLHNRESFADKMHNLTARDFYFNNLATAHYPDHRVFCTDVCHAVPALMMEMLVGSDDDGICLLPALPEGLPRGSVSGLQTRCGAEIENLTWNRDAGSVEVTLKPRVSREILLSVGDSELRTVALQENRSITVRFPYPGL